MPLRLVISEHNNLARNLLNSKEWSRRYLVPLLARGYPRADGIVAVSNGVADQLSVVTGLPRSRVTTIYNPVVTTGMLTQMEERVDDPWFVPGAPPVVMGAGRLVRQKDSQPYSAHSPAPGVPGRCASS